MSPGPARRYQGEIVEWNEEKRCGFVRSRGSSQSDPVVFLPLNAMIDRCRKPKVGDAVVYELVRIEDTPQSRRLRTQLRAHRVTSVGEKPPEIVKGGRGGWTLFGALYLAAQLALVLASRYFLWLFLASLALSALAVVQYGWDKAAAGRGARRIPERELQMVALLGGWPGAAFAQAAFRHKTQKAEFLRTFRLAVAANVVLVVAACAFLIFSAYFSMSTTL